MKGTNIYITQDLCKEDREDQKILRDNLKSAKSKNLPTKIIGKKLQINGDIYTIDQLREINREDKIGRDLTHNFNTDLNQSNSLTTIPRVQANSPGVFNFPIKKGAKEIVYVTPEQSSSSEENYIDTNNQIEKSQNTASSEKRPNTSPADPQNEKEKRKLQRTCSSSSNKSDRITRETAKNLEQIKNN